jgi:streptogramin lyase
MPFDVAAGPDGNLWFTEFGSDKIGRITPTGTITEFAVLSAGCASKSIGRSNATLLLAWPHAARAIVDRLEALAQRA